MTIYSYTCYDSATAANLRKAVGDRVSASELTSLVRACTALSAQRWSLSWYMGAGTGLGPTYLRAFLPVAGTGRQCWMAYLALDECTSTPGVAIYNQKGDILCAQTTAVSSYLSYNTQFSVYNKSYMWGPIYCSNQDMASYRTPSTSGCGVLRIGPITGQTPMTIGLMPSPFQGYTTSLGFAGAIKNDGSYIPVIHESPGGYLFDAGVLRVCEEMLDVAEGMPVIVGSLPRWTHAVGTYTSITQGQLSVCRQTNMRRWLPLINLDRKRALWVAAYTTSTSNKPTITWRINEATGSLSTATAANCVYSVNSDVLAAIPITPGMLNSGKTVAGMPMQYVSVNWSNTAYISAIGAWIGDAP